MWVCIRPTHSCGLVPMQEASLLQDVQQTLPDSALGWALGPPVSVAQYKQALKAEAKVL